MAVVHHTLWHRVAMNLHLQKSVSYACGTSNENQYGKSLCVDQLINLFTLIQIYFTYCIVFLLMDEKGSIVKRR